MLCSTVEIVPSHPSDAGYPHYPPPPPRPPPPPTPPPALMPPPHRPPPEERFVFPSAVTLRSSSVPSTDPGAGCRRTMSNGWDGPSVTRVTTRIAGFSSGQSSRRLAGGSRRVNEFVDDSQGQPGKGPAL